MFGGDDMIDLARQPRQDWGSWQYSQRERARSQTRRTRASFMIRRGAAPFRFLKD